MYIFSVQDLEQLRGRIGEVNFQRARRALRNRQEVRIYTSDREIAEDRLDPMQMFKAGLEFRRNPDKFIILIFGRMGTRLFGHARFYGQNGSPVYFKRRH
jgi:hypothetical protein